MILETLVNLLFIFAIVGLLFYIVDALSVRAPWNVTVKVLAALIALIVLLDALLGGGYTGLRLFR